MGSAAGSGLGVAGQRIWGGPHAPTPLPASNRCQSRQSCWKSGQRPPAAAPSTAHPAQAPVPGQEGWGAPEQPENTREGRAGMRGCCSWELRSECQRPKHPHTPGTCPQHLLGHGGADFFLWKAEQEPTVTVPTPSSQQPFVPSPAPGALLPRRRIWDGLCSTIGSALGSPLLPPPAPKSWCH